MTKTHQLIQIFLFISFIVGLSACKKVQNNTEDFGRTILFVSNRDGNDEIYAMRDDSTDLIRLTNNAVPDGRATWSADGLFIAYASGNAGTRDIYIMDANPGRVVKHIRPDLPLKRDRSIRKDPRFIEIVSYIEDVMEGTIQ